MLAAPQNRPRWVVRLDELHLLTPMRIVAIVFVAVLLTIVLRSLVTRLLRRTFALPGIDQVRAQARQRALATALRSALLGVIWAAAAITVVSEVGVNIGAFIATATVIGGAVAFGAQTLVRDLIAGFYVLAEDQYGVGDTVDLGVATGTVERITLRSVRLRDAEGKIWYVPHGGVARVGNLSKAASVVLDVEVDRSCSLDDLHAIATTMGGTLAETVGESLTGPPTVVGLVDLRDDRIVYRVVAPVRQGRAEDVRRAWRIAVLDAFTSGALRAPAAPSTIVTMAGAATAATETASHSVTEPE